MRVFTDLLRDTLTTKGYSALDADPSIYQKCNIPANASCYQKNGTGRIEWILVPVYVYDLYPTFSSQSLRDELWDIVSTRFQLKNLGPLRYSLGINFSIDCKLGVIKLDQSGQKKRILSYSHWSK